MKKIVALLNILLLVSMASAALADSTVSGMQNGGIIQSTDYLPVVRAGCTNGGNCKVQVGTAASQNIGTSGSTLGLLNAANTYSALQTFLSGNLAAADPVFSGGAITLPSGLTSARPSSPVTGMIRYNTSLATYEAYAAGAWGPLGSGSGSGITALTGDGTASGPGSASFALATVNSNVGTFGSASTVPQITTDGKGRITGVASVTITPAAIGAPTTNGTGASGTWGISVTGNAATSTALAALPTQCSGGQFATGIAANGTANCSTPAGGGGLTVGTTSITTGTTTRVLFDNAGVLGEYTISGTGNVAMTTSPTFTTPNLGVPSVATLTNATGLPISTGVSGLATGIAAFLATPSSANLAAALTDETDTGAAVFANSPTFVTPILGTPTSGTLTNETGLPISTGVSGLGTGVATLLGGTSSGTGGPMRTVSPTTTGTLNGAAAIWSGVDTALNFSATGTGADTLPVGTSAQRPGSPAVGMIRYNSSAPPALEAYINGQWSALNGTPNVTYTAVHTLNQGDMNGQVNATGTWPLTIPPISTTVLPAGNYVCLNNEGSGTITVTSTPTINLSTGNVTSLSLASGQLLCMVSNGTSLDSSLTSNGSGGSGITQLTGDVTAGPGSGSQAATLATVNSNVGAFTNANITVNAKGLITAAANGSTGGTVTIGTSAAATNPQRSGQAGTGLFSASSNVVGVAANGLETAEFGTVASAVDFVKFEPGLASTPPQIAVGGSTTNQHLELVPAGTGAVLINTTTQSNGIQLQINGGSANAAFEMDSSNTYGAGFFINSTAAGGKEWQFFSSTTGDGSSQAGDMVYGVVGGPTSLFDMSSAGVFGTINTGIIGFTSGGTVGHVLDTAISRDAAGILDVGTGAQGSTAGGVKAAGYMSVGTKFTASGCSNGTTIGGASAGKFTLGANTCSVTITMGNSLTAPNGWRCTADDLTAPTVKISATTGGSATTCVLSVPAGAGTSDVIEWGGHGY